MLDINSQQPSFGRSDPQGTDAADAIHDKPRLSLSEVERVDTRRNNISHIQLPIQSIERQRTTAANARNLA